MAWSLVAKVVYVVVEMVEKVVVIMGFLVKKEKKEEERVVEKGCLNLVKWRRRWGDDGE